MLSSFAEQQAMRSPDYWLNRFNSDQRDDEPANEPLVLLSSDDVEHDETEGRDAKMLIDGLLPARGFHPLIGDSGLGKSPLLMQAAVCVATGTPFLGMKVRQGKVLLNDHENAGHLLKTLRAVSRAIGKDYDRDVKENLAFLPSKEAADVFQVFSAGHRFAMVIVDALRGFASGQEIDPKVMAPLITKMSAIDTCWLVCHHLRKEDRKSPPPSLEDVSGTRVLYWLQEAAGSRAIINQASTRLAVIEPRGSEAALFVRGFVKGHGEVGPFHLERIHDVDGEEPLGYALATDWTLLGETHRAFYRQVAGRTLSRAQLNAEIGRRQTTAFLAAGESLNLFSITGRRGQPDLRYVFKPHNHSAETAKSALDFIPTA
jgi:hypothetical protein